MHLPSPHSDEAELIRDLRAGRESAFAEIVRRYRPRLLAFARRLLAGRSENAEDVVQEALLRAHRALRRDTREMRLGPWLFVLTRNCCLDELSRLRGDTVALDESSGAQILVDRRTPDVVAEGRAGLREMLDGIATLPIEQRHALVRREVDGASYADVAAELGVSSQATRALVHRARHSLVAYREAAATDVCATAQGDLLKAHRTGRRAAHATHRHLVVCADCRAYRTRLKALRRSLHAMHPGPAIALVAAATKLVPTTGKLGGLAGKLGGAGARGSGKLGGLAGKLGGAGARGSGKLGGLAGKLGGAGARGSGKLGGLAGGTAVGAKTAAVTAGALAVLGAAALGGTAVFGAGDPSPLTIRSAVIPGGLLRAGTRLPDGTAIVAQTARLRHGRATITLACPAGERVADLLPPGDPEVTAAYAPGTYPGASSSARVLLAGSHPTGAPLAVAILCRHPEDSGALVPFAQAASARASAQATGAPTSQLVAVCVAHALLLDRPRGRPLGSVSLGQPLLGLARRGAWERVDTQFHETGWLPRSAACQ
jgi:RNA polymerase sigma factor (sigma-70 family)